MRYYREIFMEFVSVCPCKSDTSDTMTVFWIVFHDSDLPLRPLINKRTNMDIVIIERKTFDLLLESVKALGRKVDLLMEKSKDRGLAKWMDSEDVCKALNLSKRSLQNLRDKDLLPCTQIGRKFYYKPADVENFILRGAGITAEDGV